MRALTSFLKYTAPGRVLDVGSGTGVCVERLRESGYDAHGLDIAANVRPDVVGCAWELPFSDGAFDYVFSSDVLEHIPENLVSLVLAEIGRVAPRAYLEWADFMDVMGPRTIGEQAHLTVKPNDWWFQQLRDAGFVLKKWGRRNHLSGGFCLTESPHRGAVH